jgi:hypothetical protein
MNVSELDLFKGGLPSYLRGAGSDDVTKILAGESSGGMRRISIKGNAFRELIGGKEYRVSEERAMNIVIIKAAPKVSRTYFAGSYSEGEAVRPTCWSSDSQKPDAAVKTKQSDTCLNCPQNIKGSGQGESRACRYSQRLAVLIEGEVDREEVYQLVLPSTSIFGEGDKGKMPLREYAKFLDRKGAFMSGVITEMKFDIASPVPKLFFRPIRAVTEEEWEVIQRLKDSEEAEKAIELTVSDADNVQKEAPAAPKKAALPAPKPAPVVEPEEDEEEVIEEPKKAAPKKAAPVAESSSLEDLIGEWDD